MLNSSDFPKDAYSFSFNPLKAFSVSNQGNLTEREGSVQLTSLY
jgi:hypothetical protein